MPTATWDVEVNPQDGNRVYATSFYDGHIISQSGINVSTDGGKTWIHPPTATPPVTFPCTDPVAQIELTAFGISIDPASPHEIYIGTSCGLAHSTDHGATWTYIDPTPGDGGADKVWDVIAHDGGIIDICGEDGHRRSQNNGVTWNGTNSLPQIPNGSCSITVSPDEPDVLFVVSGTTLYETHDGGQTWPVTYVNPSPQGRIPFMEVNDRAGVSYDLWFGDVTGFRASCTTPSTPAALTIARCPASNTWTPISGGAHNDAGAVVFDPTTPSDGCPLLYSNDGGVYYNKKKTNPSCHDPDWEQPNKTPHGLWLWDLEGANALGADKEHLYLGTQDNGSFSTEDAPKSKPLWNSRNYGDIFDLEASDSYVMLTQLAPAHIYLSDLSLFGGAEILNLPGNFVTFRHLDSIDNFGSDDFVVVTGSGVHLTLNASNVLATPPSQPTWKELGASSSPSGACAVRASVSGATPTFIVKAGGCNGRQPGSLWRFVGTGSGNWQRINRNGVSNFGVYAVDPKRPNRIFAADLSGGNVEMVLSEDGGTTWRELPELNSLMNGNGVFATWTQRGPIGFDYQGNLGKFSGYPQPTLVAFDPEDPEVLVAGGADSGIFLSIDAGTNWRLITDPINPIISDKPHLPRPRYAYFDHEPGKGDVNLYIGSQGRGVWRLTFFKNPIAAITGKISLLRVHALGSKYGVPPDQLDVEVIVRLDSSPEIGLGFQLRDNDHEATARGMLNILRDAFNHNHRVHIEYVKQGFRLGQIIRVRKSNM
jgi:photosystem II stability/assembly factor-like uncharacterized protein